MAMASPTRISAAAAILVGVVCVWPGGNRGPLDVPETLAQASAVSPWDEAQLWMAPPSDPPATSDIVKGLGLLDDGEPSDAIIALAKTLPDPVLGPYARLHIGRAHLALEDYDASMRAAQQIIETSPAGHLGESALWLLAESREGAGKWADASDAWRALSGLQTTNPATVHLRLAHAAEKAGQRTAARAAFERVYYEWPTGNEADVASAALARYPVLAGADIHRLELARAGRLFSARRFTDARKSYERALANATGADRAPIDLRLAQCDVQLQRYAKGLEGLNAYLARPAAAGRVEAEFYSLAALRGMKRPDYPDRVARFVREHSASPLAEAALNDLATSYILADDDGKAAEVFTAMYAKFPSGSYADRAAWRAGWWAYSRGNHRETIRLFESAATNLRRADYRPSWLYWAGRSHAALKQHDTARIWYRRALADYRNSYYGREAQRALAALPGGARTTPAQVIAERDPSRAIVPGAFPANAVLVRRLLAVGFYDDAIAELRRAQGETGRAPVVEATIAYALNRKGDLRPAITAMRRAYPQFMADGGEQLPDRLLKVIFPVAHSDLIRRYATLRKIDPFLLTALMAQESTFQADVRSPADAWGLMQLLPSTGRRYATKEGIRGFSTARLTHAETNVRLGTAYLSDLLARFGDAAPALAAYNAGENRVDRWLVESPGLPRDEFIDNIPFPETQNYVKRIIGTAEDYRLLYGTSVPASNTTAR